MTVAYGSLFSGVGGFDVGFDRAGMRCLWQCEIDRDARRVLAHRWPDVPCHEDITALDGAALPPVDVICGGFPCQDISVAGNRVGLVGDRSGLFFEMIRVIREMRDATGGQSPTLAVIENVPFLLRVNRGRDLAVVLGELADSGALDIGWRVLDAQWFGVAQRRRRVFVVADFGGSRPAEILALADSLRGDSPPRRTAGQGAAAGAEGGTGSRRGACWDGGQLSDTLDVSMLVKGQMMPEKRRFPFVTEVVPILEATARQGQARGSHHGVGCAGDPMFTLQATKQHAVAFDLAQVTSPLNYSNPKSGDPCHPLTGAANQSVVAIGGDVTHALTHEGHDASEDGAGRGTPIVAFTNRGSDTGVTAERLRSDPNGGQVAVAFHENLSGSYTPADHARALRSGASHSYQTIHHGMTVRRLTPRECERLQGFPDDWTLLDPPQSDAARYRQLGNAVAVPVAAWLGKRIVAALEGA